ncbi:hypothetical protein E3O19_16125 [Cryobacterium algoritolerans]|uniref:Restriction endonuclease subunit S n=1 Tax=Cryobacterium algoritolerans TaxID=1259184 RepID=A0A4R8WIC4_9MICO|nr:hypothetical protein [Cryobacterium algoritolerans]TFC09869.1 hypothetical protein E3O19_16125 [Cryobacterium algoritolerans]
MSSPSKGVPGKPNALATATVQFAETAANKDFRIDSEFWTQSPQRNPKLTYSPIGDCLLVSQYGVSMAMNESGEGSPIYRMDEIHNMICDFEVGKCAQLSDSEVERHTLNDRDVLFNRTNSYEWVGRTGVYRSTGDEAFVFASYLVRFVPDAAKLLPEYLAAFLSSRFGVADIRRRSRPSINQTNVNPEEVKAIPIPLLHLDTQSKIRALFDEAVAALLEARAVYDEASLLLASVIQGTWTDGEIPSVNVVGFSSSFGLNGRIDAEYYQPRYEGIEAQLRASPLGVDLLTDACEVSEEGFVPIPTVSYRYIELSNIDSTGSIIGHTDALGSDLPTRARRRVRSGDVLVSSVEGSLGSCAMVGDDYDGALCSTGFYIIRHKTLSPEALLVLVKSPLVQSMLKQACSGTILAAMTLPEFRGVILPRLDSDTQLQLRDLIRRNRQAKTLSANLLTLARQTVECAIETDEATAVEFLQTEYAAQHCDATVPA